MSESFGLRERPDWDHYFLDYALQASKRSCDNSTQHGCVLVLNKVPVISGYNGLPRDTDDTKYPSHRPDKYFFYCHSESNAVAMAARFGRATDGATAYVTGPPCVKCLSLLWQAGIVRIVYPKGSRGWSLDEAEGQARQLLIENTGIQVDEVEVPA